MNKATGSLPGRFSFKKLKPAYVKPLSFASSGYTPK
jgi:hypothetical protein